MITEIQNPLLTEYHTLHQTTPFQQIKLEHFEPAILQAMDIHDREIETIVNNPEKPTFINTIVALERSGALLNRVTTLFENLLSAETNDDMQAVAERMMPRLSEHSNNITLNSELFGRIKQVYENTPTESLNTEERMLLQNTYDGFIRSGANLNEAQKERFREISTEMSILTLNFSQNKLKETNGYELVLDGSQLDGLPENARETYAQAANERGKEGQYIVTLHAPSFVPFMKYSTHRELREKL